jgi:hypothetical protein
MTIFIRCHSTTLGHSLRPPDNPVALMVDTV